MSVYDDIMFPPGYHPGGKSDVERIEDKRIELEELRDRAVKARALINSEHWKELTDSWQRKIKAIVGQFDPGSPTALSEAVFGMGMLRQIYSDIEQPQESIDIYEKKKATYEKLMKTRQPHKGA